MSRGSSESLIVVMTFDKGLDTALDGAEGEGAGAVCPPGLFKEMKFPVD